MALLPEQLQRLLAMQTLCERVEGTAQELEAAVQKIAVLQQEGDTLQDFTSMNGWSLFLTSASAMPTAKRCKAQQRATRCWGKIRFGMRLSKCGQCRCASSSSWCNRFEYA